MALTASSLITTAKQRTFGAQGRQKISDAMLLGELSYQDAEVVKMFAQCAPNLLATVTGNITITSAGNTNGYTLSNAIHYRNFVHVDATDEEYTPINIIGREHELSEVRAPAGMLRLGSSAAVFYPVDPLTKRWTGSEQREYYDSASSHTVTYSYVPLPSMLSTTSASLASPDMAREVLVESLVAAILISVDTSDFGEAQLASHQLRIQRSLAMRDSSMASLRMQAYKFANPQGSPGGFPYAQTASEWVLDQVT